MTADSGRVGDWPVVSVIVPTRDRPALLRRAVNSILAQQYPGPLECIVVYDQSEPALDPYDDGHRKIVVITNDRSLGTAGARNTGIEASVGEYLAFCDDDDEWLPGKVLAQVLETRSHPEAVAVSCAYYIRYDDKEILRLPPSKQTTHRDLLRSRAAQLHPSSLMMARDRLEHDFGLIDEGLPGSYAEDYDWLLRATVSGPVVSIPQPLLRVYWHKASFFTGRWETIIAAIHYMLDKHPDFAEEPAGLARLYGRLAFAHAALGDRKEARVWAVKSLRLHPRERRAYLSLAVSSGLLKPDAAMRFANTMGKGV